MPRCPEFIWSTLEVSGPSEAVAAFMKAAAGPGFLDHRPDWYNLSEYTYFLLMRRRAEQGSRRGADAENPRPHLARP